MTDDLFVEHRQGESGIRVRGVFIPFLKKGEQPDMIVCVPWGWRTVEGATKGSCDKCGCEISLAPSSRQLLREFPDIPTRCMNCAHRDIEQESGGQDEQ